MITNPQVVKAIINIAKPAIFLIVRWLTAKEFGREAPVSTPVDTDKNDD